MGNTPTIPQTAVAGSCPGSIPEATVVDQGTVDTVEPQGVLAHSPIHANHPATTAESNSVQCEETSRGLGAGTIVPKEEVLRHPNGALLATEACYLGDEAPICTVETDHDIAVRIDSEGCSGSVAARCTPSITTSKIIARNETGVCKTDAKALKDIDEECGVVVRKGGSERPPSNFNFRIHRDDFERAEQFILGPFELKPIGNFFDLKVSDDVAIMLGKFLTKMSGSSKLSRSSAHRANEIEMGEFYESKAEQTWEQGTTNPIVEPLAQNTKEKGPSGAEGGEKVREAAPPPPKDAVRLAPEVPPRNYHLTRSEVAPPVPPRNYKRRIIVFGPPGIGKSTMIDAYGEIGYDMEWDCDRGVGDEYLVKKLLCLPPEIRIVGCGTLDPEVEYPGFTNVFLRMGRDEYLERVIERSVSRPEKECEPEKCLRIYDSFVSVGRKDLIDCSGSLSKTLKSISIIYGLPMPVLAEPPAVEIDDNITDDFLSCDGFAPEEDEKVDEDPLHHWESATRHFWLQSKTAFKGKMSLAKRLSMWRSNLKHKIAKCFGFGDDCPLGVFVPMDKLEVKMQFQGNGVAVDYRAKPNKNERLEVEQVLWVCERSQQLVYKPVRRERQGNETTLTFMEEPDVVAVNARSKYYVEAHAVMDALSPNTCSYGVEGMKRMRSLLSRSSYVNRDATLPLWGKCLTDADIETAAFIASSIKFEASQLRPDFLLAGESD
jgi:hypothetical protein